MVTTNPDLLAFLFSMIGGFAMGTYPVPIKAPSVLKAKVHPMIFQCYKSFWVFTLGFMFIIFNIIGGKPAYVFTYWGILGAAAWIPSGLGTIASVPRLGVGMAIVVNTGTSATFQFLVGIMVGEKMKMHGSPGHEYVLAPYCLIGIVLGMAGLVLSLTLKFPDRRQVGDATERLENAQSILSDVDVSAVGQPTSGTISKSDLIIGLSCAFGAGIFSALQFAVISIGHKVEDPGCTECPAHAHYINEFDSFGSYMTSFGIGAGLITPLYLGLFTASETCAGRDLPESHFQTLKLLGSCAGWFWVAGNVFQSAAVNRGGDAVMGPANQACQLITSGAWGLLYYREVRDPKRIGCWLLAAAWTVCFVILLGREKQK